MTTKACARRRNITKKNKFTKSKKPMGCGVCSNADAKYKCPKCRFPYCSVKCCKDHKENCPALKPKEDSKNNDNHGNTVDDQKMLKGTKPSHPEKISKYLSAEQLTRDPLENALRRRGMLEESDDDDDIEEGWRINRNMMDKIDSSEWLRKELTDGGLRQIIAQIDMADEEEPDGHRKRSRKRPKLGAVPDPSPREISLMKARHTNPKFSKFIDRLLVSTEVLVEAEKTTEQNIASFFLGESNEQIGLLSLAPIEKKKNKMQSENIDGIYNSDSGNDSNDSSDDDQSSSSSSSS